MCGKGRCGRKEASEEMYVGLSEELKKARRNEKRLSREVERRVECERVIRRLERSVMEMERKCEERERKEECEESWIGIGQKRGRRRKI